MASDTKTLLLSYLEEAHATEQALVTNLHAHIAMTPRGSYRTSLERHLTETQEHERAVARRIREIGRGRGVLGAAYGVLTTAVGQALVLTKGPLDLLRGGPRGEEKLLKNARDEVVTEAVEIAIYDTIEALARALGDEPTARLAARHRADEEQMLGELRSHIPHLAQAVAQARAGQRPSFDWSETPAAEAHAGHAPARAREEGAAADLRLRVADRQRGGREAHRLHAGAAEGDDRLRARAPQARDGDRARAEPARGRAVQGLRRADRARRRAAADQTPTRRPRAACASTRGGTSAASRCSRPPSASSAGRRHERRAWRSPPAPRSRPRPRSRTRRSSRPCRSRGRSCPDTPDGPEPAEPNDPLPADPDGPEVPPPNE